MDEGGLIILSGTAPNLERNFLGSLGWVQSVEVKEMKLLESIIGVWNIEACHFPVHADLSRLAAQKLHTPICLQQPPHPLVSLELF